MFSLNFASTDPHEIIIRLFVQLTRRKDIVIESAASLVRIFDNFQAVVREDSPPEFLDRVERGHFSDLLHPPCSLLDGATVSGCRRGSFGQIFYGWRTVMQRPRSVQWMLWFEKSC